MTAFRWGVLGPGNIARQFAKGLTALPDHQLLAAGSRSQERAAAFIKDFGGERAYGSYAELIADPDVDAIYIATPHTQHLEGSLACLAAGKPVLCEKPLAVNGAQVEQIVNAARQHQTFLMEAMWTRFLPIMNPIRRWIDQDIGTIRQVRASFSFRGPWKPDGRLLNPELAGGGLLDVGVYVIAFALWAFGQVPDEIKAIGHVGETGVDEHAALLLHFPGGGMAVLDCGVQTSTTHAAEIFGTDGRIAVDAPFWKGTKAQLYKGQDLADSKTCEHWSNGYEYEAAEVARCVAAGLQESPDVSWQHSADVMAVIDEARKQLGVVYPCETAAV